MSLTKHESDAIGEQIAAIEARCGGQIVTAIIGKADHYVELPWKAFALGASLTAAVVVAADALRPDWLSAYAALSHALAILGAGAVSALAAIYLPAYARLFLRPARRDAEVRLYAQSLFLRRELFKTQLRRGILVMVAMFERKVEILADTGLHASVRESEWRTVVASMTPELGAGHAAAALQQGLARLDKLLLGKGLQMAVGEANELPDRPIEERAQSENDPGDARVACARHARGGVSARCRRAVSHREGRRQRRDPQARDARKADRCAKGARASDRQPGCDSHRAVHRR